MLLPEAAPTSLLPLARVTPAAAAPPAPPPPAGAATAALAPQPQAVQLTSPFDWENYGRNLRNSVGTLYRLSNGALNQAAVGLAACQWAVRHLASTGGTGCASGSRWSFSPVAQSQQALFDVRMMAKQLAFAGPELHDPTEAASLLQVQAGTTVQQLIAYAEGAQRDLPAMGGNCGQTVAGAIATGTHGGFLGQPGFPDMVRALYLVGEGGRRHWIERASRPVLSPATKATYRAAGVQVHDADDETLNHAVVGLGTFGLIYSVTFQTVPAYRVSFSREVVDYDDALDDATFDEVFDGASPLDFATVVNPFAMHSLNGHWRGTGVGSAVRTRVDPASPSSANSSGAGGSLPLNDADLSRILAAFATAVPALVRPLVGQLLTTLYGPRTATGPMSVAYPLSLTHAPTLGMEIGVEAARGRHVFGTILDHLQNASTPLPGVVAIRRTAKSAATLSMARWEPTLTFEFACLGVSGTEELLTGVLDALERQAVPFTLHLGMLHGRDSAGQSWLTAQRFQQMFGAAEVQAFIAARALTCPQGNVFATPLTRSLGLTP